jgi:chromosome segregation ATPase
MELQINDPEIITARELATHANEIKHLQEDMDKLIKDMEEVKQSLNEIRKILAEDHASKKTMHMAINLFAAIFGGVIVTVLQKFWK